MSDLTQAQNEALLASADKHEDAAKEIRVIIDNLFAAGYSVYAGQLTEVVVAMISHVDHAREIARRK